MVVGGPGMPHGVRPRHSHKAVGVDIQACPQGCGCGWPRHSDKVLGPGHSQKAVVVGGPEGCVYGEGNPFISAKAEPQGSGEGNPFALRRRHSFSINLG